jgi:hypothetical protein
MSRFTSAENTGCKRWSTKRAPSLVSMRCVSLIRPTVIGE